MAKKKHSWGIGDVFDVPLLDGMYAIGQVVDDSIPNTASCAFFRYRVSQSHLSATLELSADDIIASATVVAAHLDREAWKVLRRLPVLLSKRHWPNEQTRGKGWVGSRVYTGAILEDFLNAFHGLSAWDQYHDPKYMDALLISPDKKPVHLVYQKGRGDP